MATEEEEVTDIRWVSCLLIHYMQHYMNINNFLCYTNFSNVS